MPSFKQTPIWTKICNVPFDSNKFILSFLGYYLNVWLTLLSGDTTDN